MAQKKTVDYRSGSALLKKQLADRAGKKVGLPSKKNVKNLTKLAATVATVAGPGKVVKAASKAAKAVKAAKATKAAAKTTKNLPKPPTVKNPPKVPGINKPSQSSGSKAIQDIYKRDAKIKAQKAADLAEDRRRLAQMARDKAANKPKPTKRGAFSGNLASYNRTGK
jgi:hypothetical protein